jgi:RNA polymerase primary sigma factor
LLARDPLTREEEMQLSRRIRDGDESARWDLALANARFAYRLAKVASRGGIDFESLFSEAIRSMFVCAKNFDASQGKFVTFSKAEIRRRLDLYVADFGGAYRLPYQAEAFRRKARGLLQEDEIEAIDTEGLAERLRCTRKMASAIKTVLNGRAYLDADIGDQGNEIGRMSEFIRDDAAPNPVEIEEKRESLQELQSLLGSIDERTKQIMILRYGLDGKPPRNLGQIGKIYRISRERVRQIEFMGLRALRTEVGRRKSKSERARGDALANLRRLKQAA